MQNHASKIGVSQYTVVTTAIPQGLQLLARTGIPGLELFVEGPQWWDAEALQSLRAAGSLFSGALSVHPPSWDINIASYTRPVRETAIDVYRQAIEWASRLSATYVVIHVGWRADPAFPRTECLARAEEAIGRLASHAVRAGVLLAVENVGWFGQEVCDQKEFTSLISRLPAGTGALLDVGHARLAGWNVAQAARDLAGCMIAMHLHDNDGRSDQHLPIGDGTLDWDGLLPLLPAMRADCQYIIEYAPGTPLERVRMGGELLSRVLG